MWSQSRSQATGGQLVVFNIYNDCSNDHTIHELTSFHRTNCRLLSGRDADTETHHIIWLGNFNRHHPAWDNLEDNRLFTREALEKAEVLIKATAEHGLEMALAPGMPTHIHNVTKRWTRLNHIFLTEHTSDRILICEAWVEERGLNTDHIPIITKLDITIGRSMSKAANNFRNVDWDEFWKALEEKMKDFSVPKRLSNQAEVNQECDRLAKVLQETISQTVPATKVCPYSKHWWTKELKELRKCFRKIGRKTGKHRHSPEHAIHAEFKEVCKQYDKAIKYSKQHHQRDWLERATEPDIWTANKYITAPMSDRGKTRIPVLKQELGETETIASSNHNKSKLLAKV
jgi:hypothetical protein